MEQVIIECVIPTPEGRNIWNNNFSQGNNVDIDNLCTTLFKTYSQDAAKENALKFIFEDKITMEDFGNAIAWFGQLPEPFFKNITYLYSCDWYHHKLTEKQVKTLIGNKKEGWLVKLNDKPGEFEFVTADWKAIIYSLPTGEIWYDGTTYKDWPDFMKIEITKFGIDLKNVIVNIK